MESVLVTGASGFIGSFIVEEALRRGFGVWAGVRSSSSREYLQDKKIHFLELDFAHPNELRAQLSGHKGTYSKFDYIIHCAGATKCVDKNDFERVNYLQTKYFVDTLRELNMIPRQFIFISTLSVFGPIREKTYTPITGEDTPMPNTAYGLSKLKAEIYLQSIPGFPYVIYRPTGVYGPREKDYFLMVKSIRQHTDFSVGFRRQDLTFVYVKDIVQAVFLGIEKQISCRAYFLADGKVYQSRAFSDLIRKELGNPFVIRLRCPLIILKVVSLLAEYWAKRRNTTSTLNSDKYRIMKQRNWQCDITPAVKELGYSPGYDLERGVKETIAWYKDKGWL
ncbi:UDP-glucose 4-epimerase [Bacteroides clarus YIT 12056]|uniref:NAD dependent epimerase/dehydratase family protein n=1 Tax=Bacteroides clarus YIT 12056 TaxID=762984 RepID=A0ABN0CNG1_9BACE|nr:NAD(P)-dependent oxidoreductase [Bacteroides clarus]EGF51460.1 NAD dependent epimerase/dehydratase family protein [Bacteroides clarus YIT 12056]SHG95608.1 UDP-glucose 4-epimerase [Bacteroides clarus YIT 12056]